MASSFEAADAAFSQRLLDQHDVVVDAFGGKLLLFPFNVSQRGLNVLESGCADGELTPHFQNVLNKQRQATGYNSSPQGLQIHQRIHM